MKNLVLGIILGSVLTTLGVGAADYLAPSSSNYLHTNEFQSVLGEIRTREALETIQMYRQDYLDNTVHEAGRTPCQR